MFSRQRFNEGTSFKAKPRKHKLLAFLKTLNANSKCPRNGECKIQSVLTISYSSNHTNKLKSSA